MSTIKERVEIDGDSSSVQRAAKSSEKALTGAFLKSQLAAQALTKVMGFMKESIQASVDSAIEYQKTSIRLSAALQAQGADVVKTTGLLEAQSTVLERITGISQEEIRTLQTRAVNLGVQTTAVDDLVRASVSLANVSGQDVTAAFQALAMSFQGIPPRTLKMVAGIGQLTKAQLEQGDAVRAVNEAYGSFVDVTTRGGVGHLNQLGTAWGNLGKAIAMSVTESKAFREEAEAWSAWAIVLQKNIEQGKVGKGLFDALFASEGALRRQADFLRKVELGAKVMEEIRAKQRELEFPTLAPIPERPKPATKPGTKAEGEEFIGPPISVAMAASDKYIELANRTQDGLREIQEANAARRVDLEMATNEKIQQLTEDQAKKQAKTMNRAVGIASDFITGAIDALVSGADFSEFVKSFLHATGMQMIASGVKNMLEGAALSFFGGVGAPLIALGKTQLLTGGAMLGGSLIVPGGGAVPSGGGGARGSRSGASFGGPGGPPSADSGQGPATINIVFNGPTTKPEVGIAIREALREAEALGV